MQKVYIDDISEAQLRKLERGLPIQLRYEQYKDQCPSHQHAGWVCCHPDVMKRLGKAHKVHKGSRMRLTQPEIEVSAEGLGKLWSWIKNKAAPAVVKGAKFLKDHVIDTPFYQQNIRPELHKAVDTLEHMLPENAITNIAKKGIDVIGEKSAAFGIEEKKTKSKPKSKPKSKKPASKKPVSKKSKTSGGSFLPLGQ